MGDPRGIGPEVIRKALADRAVSSRGRFIVIGSKKILKGIASSVSIVDIPYKAGGEGALKFLDKGIAFIKSGVADALVTAPLAKEAVSRYHQGFVGHTEYLAQAFGVKKFDMMFVAPHMRLTIATRHVALKDVPRLIKPQLVLNSIELMALTLKEQFKIRDPKIAVLGLNPHAGEKGLLGQEDSKHILPAIKTAQQRGIKAYGPLPADTFFAIHCHSQYFCHSRARGNPFDGIIAMYHDQGLAPVKALYFKDLVNFTAGLPFVRTSPVHGTAFDIAGKNKADASLMKAAIKLACQLA